MFNIERRISVIFVKPCLTRQDHTVSLPKIHLIRGIRSLPKSQRLRSILLYDLGMLYYFYLFYGSFHPHYFLLYLTHRCWRCQRMFQLYQGRHASLPLLAGIELKFVTICSIFVIPQLNPYSPDFHPLPISYLTFIIFLFSFVIAIDFYNLNRVFFEFCLIILVFQLPVLLQFFQPPPFIYHILLYFFLFTWLIILMLFFFFIEPFRPTILIFALLPNQSEQIIEKRCLEVKEVPKSHDHIGDHLSTFQHFLPKNCLI